MVKGIHPKNGSDMAGSGNHGTLNQSQMTIGSVSTVLNEFQPSMPLIQKIGRQRNMVNLINPGSLQQFGGNISGFSQYESMNGEDGVSFGSGLMQSMSSIAAGQASANVSNKIPGRINKGPSSTASNTADNSINRIGLGGSSGSVMSIAGYDSQNSAIFQKQRNLMMSSKQQQILDKNRRKMFLQNLRNDKSDRGKNIGQ